MSPTPNEFSNFQFGQKANDGNYASHGDAYSGEFTQVRPDSDMGGGTPIGLENGSTYPNAFGYGYDANNGQFSSDKSDTPEAMASETAENQSAFADLQNFLNNNLETPGSRVCHDQTKPWEPPHGE